VGGENPPGERKSAVPITKRKGSLTANSEESASILARGARRKSHEKKIVASQLLAWREGKRLAWLV